VSNSVLASIAATLLPGGTTWGFDTSTTRGSETRWAMRKYCARLRPPLPTINGLLGSVPVRPEGVLHPLLVRVYDANVTLQGAKGGKPSYKGI
jgi:hypothetical protein